MRSSVEIGAFRQQVRVPRWSQNVHLRIVDPQLLGLPYQTVVGLDVSTVVEVQMKLPYPPSSMVSRNQSRLRTRDDDTRPSGLVTAALLLPRRSQVIEMAGVEGLEPPTLGLEIRCSIRLSYTPALIINMLLNYNLLHLQYLILVCYL